MAKSVIEWDPDAEKRINKVPFFVRKMARAKVEKAAADLGKNRITVELIEQIKAQEMGK